MSSETARQEVLNVHLAILLSKLGLEGRAERRKSGRIPDFRIRHPRLGIILGEAEIGSNTTDSSAVQRLTDRVSDRFRDPRFNGMNFILVVTYSKDILDKVSRVDEVEVGNLLAESDIGLGLAVRQNGSHNLVWYNSPVKVAQIQRAIDELAHDIMTTGLRSEDVAENLSIMIEDAPNRMPRGGTWDNLWKEKADLFEIPVKSLSWDDAFSLFAKTLATLIASCLIVYELASQRFPDRLRPIEPMTVYSLTNALRNLREINYNEATELVTQVLGQTPSSPDIDAYLGNLYPVIRSGLQAIRVSGWDILAYIYQRFLSERFRKAYATFYTKYPAANLLASLAIQTEEESVADLAMGSGSLLLASLHHRVWLGLGSEKIYEVAEHNEKEPVLDTLNKMSLDRTAGLDALRASVALSSSMLTIASLAVQRPRLHLYHVPVGIDSSGTLELLNPKSILFRKEREVFEEGFDVVLMNPPFTRSDRISSEFIGEQAREKLLRESLYFGKIKLSDVFAAGLAKPFLALADRVAKRRIGCVLPNSILSRESWADVRKGLTNSYTLQYVVTSWAQGTPNFSSDTEFREILLVMEKGTKNSTPLKVINLLHRIDEMDTNTTSIVAESAKRADSASTVTVGHHVIAEIVPVEQTMVRQLSDNLYRLVAFRDRSLLELHLGILKKSKSFSDLFEIGSEVDHTSGLSVTASAESSVPTYYNAVWGSGKGSGIMSPYGDHSKDMIYVSDESQVKIRFWENEEYFSDMFIIRRAQLDTQYLLTFQLAEKSISNVWWPIKPKPEAVKYIPSFLAYMNSSLGYLLMLGERLETRALWVEYKKGTLKNMRIPIVEPPINEEWHNGLKKALGNSVKISFGEFVKKMARLEEQNGGTLQAIDSALTDNELSTRAILDKNVLEMLRSLGINPVHICGDKFYRRILNEQILLQEIMRTSEGGTRPNLPREVGPIATGMVGQDSMDSFIEEDDDRHTNTNS